MRLPTDATLLIGEGADAELERVWREESLPVLPLQRDLSGLEAALEALATATVVACGRGGAEAAAAAARLGYRTFLVDEEASVEGVRCASLAEALEAARMARARERWRAARAR